MQVIWSHEAYLLGGADERDSGGRWNRRRLRSDQLLMGRLTESSSAKYHKNISQQEASSEVLSEFQTRRPESLIRLRVYLQVFPLSFIPSGDPALIASFLLFLKVTLVFLCPSPTHPLQPDPESNRRLF